MLTARLLAVPLLSLASLLVVPALRADDATNAAPAAASTPPAATTPMDLIDFSAPDSDKKFTADGQSGTQVTFKPSEGHPGLLVTIAPGAADYPGVDLKAPSGAWDLSAYGHIEVTITNTSSAPTKLTIGIRVDEAASWQNNDSEMGYLDAGETQTVKVQFGMSFGKPGFPVNKAAVGQILIMTDKTTGDPKTFRIDAIKAVPAGK